MTSFDLVAAIERRFDVAHWRSGDVDLWPPARMDLHQDIARGAGAVTAPPPPPFALRAAASLATPLTNLIRSRHDLAHWLARPARADAVLLGDGVSLDRIDGAWQDRHGEPVLAALERTGRCVLQLQPGPLNRLPWHRATLAANTIAARGAIGAAFDRGRRVALPDHPALVAWLAEQGIAAPSLAPERLARRAHAIAATATRFQRVLGIARPKLAFVVTCYAGLGHAFALACRREGILCVDLQHCPQGGAHKAYGWEAVPARGYTTLPGAFWTWQARDAAHIAHWADTLGARWHQAIHGGHSQLAAFLDDDDPATRRWDAQVAALAPPGDAERDILVALQPIGGQRAIWSSLARLIAASPPCWRWWIRRHPASTPAQDSEYADLPALRGAHVLIEPAAALPLPALLRHMSALVSLASGAAGEAAMFGVPAFFLLEESRRTFPGLLAAGQAEIVGIAPLVDRIAAVPRRPARPRQDMPKIEDSLARLDAMAADYAELCRTDVSITRTPATA